MKSLKPMLWASFVALVVGTAGRAAPAESQKPSALNNDPHLVGWWKFDETTGKNAADSSGKNHHGTLEGGASFDTLSTSGRIGGAIKFEGKDDCIRIAGWKGVCGQKARTIAAWIKASAPSGAIISWGTEEPGKMWTFGYVRGRIGVVPKGGYYYMKAETHDDTWHHVAVVLQEASPPNLHDHVKLFKDGEPAEVHDIGLLDLWPIDTGDKLDVVIGKRFKGLIDDLRVYDRVLSEDEINALFKMQGDSQSNKNTK